MIKINIPISQLNIQYYTIVVKKSYIFSLFICTYCRNRLSLYYCTVFVIIFIFQSTISYYSIVLHNKFLKIKLFGFQTMFGSTLTVYSVSVKHAIHHYKCLIYTYNIIYSINIRYLCFMQCKITINGH